MMNGGSGGSGSGSDGGGGGGYAFKDGINSGDDRRVGPQGLMVWDDRGHTVEDQPEKLVLHPDNNVEGECAVKL
jgi:hypothetical protein